jgi:hypothetical protein
MSQRSKHTGNSDPHPTPTAAAGVERRSHRRHDLDNRQITVERWDGARRGPELGQVIDLSASGFRIRAKGTELRPDHQIRVRLSLPSFAGISPFIHAQGQKLEPATEWVGWVTVNRVEKREDHVEIAGRLVDMDELDRGMLGLYLSTQPLAA